MANQQTHPYETPRTPVCLHQFTEKLVKTLIFIHIICYRNTEEFHLTADRDPPKVEKSRIKNRYLPWLVVFYQKDVLCSLFH